MYYISPIVSYACNLGINILSFNAKFFLCNYCFVRRRENAKFFQALDVICTCTYMYFTCTSPLKNGLSVCFLRNVPFE
jgi:hypothetical protein